MDEETAVIIFDGDCMVCNKFIQFVIKRTSKEYVFVAGKNTLGKKLLKEYNIESKSKMDTIYLIEKEKVSIKSKAIQKTLSNCGFFPKSLSLLMRCFPYFIKDKVYDINERNRKKKNHCQLISNPRNLKLFQ